MAYPHEIYKLIVNDCKPWFGWHITTKDNILKYHVAYEDGCVIMRIYNNYMEIAHFDHLFLEKPIASIPLQTGSLTRYSISLNSDKNWVLSLARGTYSVAYTLQHTSLKIWEFYRDTDTLAVAKFIQSDPRKSEGGTFTFLDSIAIIPSQLMMMLMCHAFTVHYKYSLDIRSNPHLVPPAH
ncbi:hypothetical protein DSO57_1029918 [Entomophthora muscae]|uniref:Uncharacterized protein n=1 Tax=Entomophthora muscae TaxID=34485 RepID=A0ACC2RS67_9FUNG|nr:hypothetical protein DSO57_1029918 [Entomophthora muscae]